MKRTRQNLFETPRQFYILISFAALIAVALLVGQPSGKATAQEKPKPTPPVHSPNAPEIVGGSLASAGEYPWQVALVYSNYPNPYQGQFCGGTLIAQQWVLSAGHCVVDDYGSVVDPGDIDVVLGVNFLSQGLNSGSSGQRIGVDHIYLYPGFNYGANDEVNQDASLLHLESPAALNSCVGTIALAGPSDTSQVAAGVTSTVTGWGVTTESGTTSPDGLREVEVPIVSFTTCANGYAGKYQLSDSYHLCAGLPGGTKDSCYGDSGGPLIVPNGSGWLQAGIVSFGIGCAEPDYYGIYSRVSYFKSWINSKMGSLFSETIINDLTNPIYLPTIFKSPSNSSVSCGTDVADDSDNISDALVINSGGTVSGTTNYSGDMDDVYKIYVSSGKKLTITMTGSGGDSDLYLFAPDAEDVTSDVWFIRSTNNDNNETISSTVNESGFWYIDIYSKSNTTTNYQVTVTVTDS